MSDYSHSSAVARCERQSIRIVVVALSRVRVKNKAKGKEIKVRIFRISDKKGSDTEATLGRFGKSLRNKDTTVIIVGHSTGTTGDREREDRNEPVIGNGVALTDGELQATVLVPRDEAVRPTYLDKINASGVMIFTCNIQQPTEASSSPDDRWFSDKAGCQNGDETGCEEGCKNFARNCARKSPGQEFHTGGKGHRHNKERQEIWWR